MPYQTNAVLQKIIAQKLLDLAGKSINFHNKKIIDIGSGSGFIAQHLVQNGINPQNITQVDINQESLNYAQKFGKVFKADFNFPIEMGEKYDIIFSSMALHWAKDLQNALISIKNLLNANGHIFISMPIQESLNKIYDIIKTPHFQFPTKKINGMQEIMYKEYASNCYTTLRNIHIEKLKLHTKAVIKKDVLRELKENNTRWYIGFFTYSSDESSPSMVATAPDV